MRTSCILTNIDRTFGHRKKGANLRQIGPQHAATNLTAQCPQVFDIVGSLPDHEIAIRTDSIQSKTAHQSLLAMLLINLLQLLSSLLPYISRQSQPLRIKL